MSIRKVNFVLGEYYHLYNRGNSKQKIFRDNQDYQHFVSLLYIFNTEENRNIYNLKRNTDFDIYSVANKDPLVSIGAYCLMPNHFHIMLTQNVEGGISKFIQKVMTAYVMYYNNKYQRTGSLFEGKFKSEHTDNDRHLKYLFSYIHLNPVKLIDRDWKEKVVQNSKKIFDYLRGYEYSSYLDFLGIQRVQNKVINIKNFPDYFSDKESFTSEIFSWLSL